MLSLLVVQITNVVLLNFPMVLSNKYDYTKERQGTWSETETNSFDQQTIIIF